MRKKVKNVIRGLLVVAFCVSIVVNIVCLSYINRTKTPFRELLKEELNLRRVNFQTVNDALLIPGLETEFFRDMEEALMNVDEITVKQGNIICSGFIDKEQWDAVYMELYYLEGRYYENITNKEQIFLETSQDMRSFEFKADLEKARLYLAYITYKGADGYFAFELKMK